MTTNQCPLIYECVRQLKMHRQPGLDADVDIEELEFSARRVNYTPEYVRYRAFYLIEEMLALISSRYQEFRRESSPNLHLKLDDKNWSELTKLKDELEKLDREAELELADYSLGGCSVFDEFTVIHFNGKDEPRTSREYQDAKRISLAQDLVLLTAVLTDAIRALRPYLRNEEADVRIVSRSLAMTLRRVYGPGAASHLSTFILKLIDMRM